MKTKLIAALLIATAIYSCQREAVPAPENIAPPAVIITYADSVDGIYTGTDVFHHYSITQSVDEYDTTAATLTVSIDSSASNQIVIGADTFALDSANHFSVIHATNDPHFYNAGSFVYNAPQWSLQWSKGAFFMSGGYSHTFSGVK